jgi:hypothetical protein
MFRSREILLMIRPRQPEFYLVVVLAQIFLLALVMLVVFTLGG